MTTTTVQAPSIEERVARGAALLDEKQPDWFQQIDLDKLKLDCPARCVLGHLYGSFDRGAFVLGIAFKEAAYGFDGFEEHSELSALQAEWVRVITARREQVTR
ncbi:hypothetical protein [Kutzneria albida]|uniref:Uncharacterized protein n=1 Tax=Kutzneria albida DSM 43870 TaxID=1449976 RepID=W5WBV9_9PSEU|nr:hypothetical protein [Kutzneria albida]AHH98235.1 hypothetical protein KALB_4873 [Kutzneria albida DSM 43870]